MDLLNLCLARLARSITYIKFTSKCYVYINFTCFNKNLCVIGSSIPKNKKKMHHDYAIKSYEHFYFLFSNFNVGEIEQN
jgi:hypothetical protein